jgi:uncharacterized phage protein (TIGR02218 family)
MRAAIWETSTGALAALLNSRAPINKADLYTVTLSGGSVLRWSGSDLALSGGGNTWALGPGLKRNGVRFIVGVEVDALNITLNDNASTTINGVPLVQFIRAGGLNGARIQLDKAFWGATDTAPVGAVQWFAGRVAEVSTDRYEARITVKSDIELLDVMVPRDLYQAGCLNTLYDSMCGLDKTALAVNSTASGATESRRITFSHALGQADGYFDLGVVKFTTGANAGISRTIKTHVAGSITVLQPWPFPVAVSDAFTAYPGCNKLQSTCTSKFGNLARFRGMPYIPVPETIV